jgi:hypothetical protein
LNFWANEHEVPSWISLWPACVHLIFDSVGNYITLDRLDSWAPEVPMALAKILRSPPILLQESPDLTHTVDLVDLVDLVGLEHPNLKAQRGSIDRPYSVRQTSTRLSAATAVPFPDRAAFFRSSRSSLSSVRLMRHRPMAMIDRGLKALRASSEPVLAIISALCNQCPRTSCCCKRASSHAAGTVTGPTGGDFESR